MGKFLKFFASTTLLSIFLFTLACLANAATFTVDTVTDTDDAQPGNGSCADSGGNCSLRAAIQEANALSGADVIDLPVGTYALTLPSALPDISGDLTINGAGSDSTIIDGGEQYRVFSIPYHSPLYQVVISSVTITGGSVLNSDMGGGIYSRGALTITDSLIDSNMTGVSGAGGGITNFDGILTITNSKVSNNSTGLPWAQNSGIGGGIYNKGTLTITNSTISGNFSHRGGGIFHGPGTLSIINSTISSNYSTQIPQVGDGNGGGIFANNGSVDINGSTINNNKAYDGSCCFLSASGIYNGNATMTITNSTISGNGGINTPLTGGIANAGGTLTISSSTISNNNDASGGGTGGIKQESGTVSLFNTIVANQAGGADCSGTITSIGYNLDSDGTCGLPEDTDISAGFVKLGPLSDNGGPTWTHELILGSQALDAADNAVCPSVDQRGVKRPQGTACDMGAYESIPYWELKASLSTNRYYHSASVLDNKLYAFGGVYISELDFRDTVQRYDPGTDAWDDVLSMIYDHDQGGVGVVDGYAYVMGGRKVENYGEQPLIFTAHNIIERYDPLAHSWMKMPTALYYPMHGFATATVNKKIYVIGGIGDPGGYLNLVTEYDPGTGIMTVKSPMPTARAFCSASVVGGKIYVFGGDSETEMYLNTVEIYDPSTDHWSTGTNMTVGRRHLASAAYGKYIYLFGGFNGETLRLIEEYDTKTNTWTNCQGVCPSMPSMPEARAGHTATTFNGKIHILGGVSISSNHIVFTPPRPKAKAIPWILPLLLPDD